MTQVVASLNAVVNPKTRKKKRRLIGLKVMSKCLKRKERNCDFEDLGLRYCATKISVRTCALQRHLSTFEYEYVIDVRMWFL